MNRREDYLVEHLDRKGHRTDLRPWAIEAIDQILADHPEPLRALCALLAAIHRRCVAIDLPFTQSKFGALSRQPVKVCPDHAANAQRVFKGRVGA